MYVEAEASRGAGERATSRYNDQLQLHFEMSR